MNFDEVLVEIRRQMADGDANWQMPWHGKQVVPLNVARGIPYRGINRLILWARYRECSWEDRAWGTFSQWGARKDHAQYLNTWLALMDDKPVWFWRASSLAQKAVNFLRDMQPEDPPSDNSMPSWFQPEPTQIDMLAPELIGTGRK